MQPMHKKTHVHISIVAALCVGCWMVHANDPSCVNVKQFYQSAGCCGGNDHQTLEICGQGTYWDLTSQTCMAHVDPTDSSQSPKENVYAWLANPTSNLSDPALNIYPEADLSMSGKRAGSSFHCGGGGNRAYTACVGALRAWHSLNMTLPSHLLGASGGAWFTMVYSYIPTTAVQDDVELLGGEYKQPSDLTLHFLGQMPDKNRSMLAAVTRNIKDYLKTELVEKALKLELDIKLMWQNALYKAFLEPYGIQENNEFSWNRTSWSDGTQSIEVRPNRPYPIIGSTYVIPQVLGVMDIQPEEKRQYTFHSISPMYVGFDYARIVNYDINIGTYHLHRLPLSVNTTIHKEILLGGLIEPRGADSEPPESVPFVQEGKRHGNISIARKKGHRFPLQRALAHSSFYPATKTFNTNPIQGEIIMDTMNYWSVNGATPDNNFSPSNHRFYVGDGGAVDNFALMTSLRRGNRSLILWENSAGPLNPDFNATARPPHAADISHDISGLFGYYFTSTFTSDRENQIFNQTEFPRVVTALQDAQQRGNGAVGTFLLTTIQNDYFGIPAGLDLNVTIYHCGRVFNWEDQLPPVVKQHVVPSPLNRNATELITSGTFANFPLYSVVDQLTLTAEQANLLASMTSWVVQENRLHFDL